MWPISTRMTSGLARPAIALFCSALGVATSAPAAPQPRTTHVQAVVLPLAPKIDGKLDPVWHSASCIDSFEGLGGEKLTQKTEAYVGYRDEAIYIAFVCHESRMEDIIAAARQRDSVIYGDDCVEIFINPDRNLKTYFQFQINS